MIVCAHGNVDEYCAEHGMVICDTWDGELESYDGPCKVLVTDREMPEGSYYYLKNKLLIRGIELVSILHADDPAVVQRFIDDAEDRKVKYGARQPFGYKKVAGAVVEDPEAMAVVRRILELRKQGLSYRQIRESDGIRHSDGRQISVSTIREICMRK